MDVYLFHQSHSSPVLTTANILLFLVGVGSINTYPGVIGCWYHQMVTCERKMDCLIIGDVTWWYLQRSDPSVYRFCQYLPCSGHFYPEVLVRGW